MTLNESGGIGFVGLGAVGCALARAFHAADFRITALIDPDVKAAQQIADELAISGYAADYPTIDRRTKTLIIAVPDDAIRDVDNSLAAETGDLQLTVCAHTSGAFPGMILHSMAQRGLPVGSLHPLQTFPSRYASPSLEGTYFAIEGNKAVQRHLRSLVTRIGGIPIEITTDGKVLYHIAAVFASNFFPIIFREAVDILENLGISDENARRMLAPLVRSTVENCLHSGAVNALTGPIVRGDYKTIKHHLAALEDHHPDKASLYKILSLRSLELAREKDAHPKQLDKIQDLLL